jgi:hypothetical protein
MKQTRATGEVGIGVEMSNRGRPTANDRRLTTDD